jgi:hypothetical protein
MLISLGATQKTYFGTANATGNIITGSSSGDTVLRSNGHDILFSVDSGASEAMRIDSSGNVIVNANAGTSDAGTVRITGGTSGLSNLQFADTADGNIGMLQYNHASNHMLFQVNNAERMLINSSGTVLIDTTNPDVSFSTSSGSALQPSGQTHHSAAGTSLVLNRTASNGTIAQFRKGGSTVGSIGVADGDNIYIASDDTNDVGLKFNGDGNRITPCNASGADRGSAIDLGEANSGPFKDLYLSGGIQFDARSNKLDDYEEGTWLPGLEFASPGSTATTQSSTYTTGSYIKIGSAVTVQFNISGVTFGNGTGNVRFQGLPFTPNGISAYPGKSTASSGHLTSATTSSSYVDILKIYGVNPLNVMFSSNGGAWDFLNSGNATTVAPNSINGSFTYYTNS